MARVVECQGQVAASTPIKKARIARALFHLICRVGGYAAHAFKPISLSEKPGSGLTFGHDLDSLIVGTSWHGAMLLLSGKIETG